MSDLMIKFLFTFLVIAISFSTHVQANIKQSFMIGISISEYDRVNQNKVKRLILKVSQEFEKLFPYKLNIVFFDKNEKLEEEFVRFEKINMLITYTSFYLKHKTLMKQYGVNPFILKDENNQKTQYYLVANKQSGIQTLKDIKGKSYSSFDVETNYKVWLDYLALKEFGQSYQKIIRLEQGKQKYNAMLLDVYFNKHDFTIVSKHVYEDMILLNPSIRKNLTIVQKSEPIFLYSVGYFHKQTSPELIDAFNTLIEEDGFKKAMSELLDFLGLLRLERIDFNDLKKLEDFYEEYLALKNGQK